MERNFSDKSIDRVGTLSTRFTADKRIPILSELYVCREFIDRVGTLSARMLQKSPLGDFPINRDAVGGHSITKACSYEQAFIQIVFF